MPQVAATQTQVGKVAPQLMDFSGRTLCRFEAVLTATAGQVASVRCRPLAADTDGHPGFPVGGEVTISGTADSNGLVGAEGFPFWSSFPRYGFEVLAISGAGATVAEKVGC